MGPSSGPSHPRILAPVHWEPVVLTVGNVSKLYGVDIVLEGVNLRVDRREKVALVGRNGTGKTTLVKIIAGLEEPDSGTVLIARGAKVGYLRQETQVDPNTTLLEEAQRGQQDKRAMQARLDQLEAKLQNHPSDDDLEEYALLHEHFLESEGYAVESDVRSVLKRMGFTEDEFDRPTSALSGGERTRLALARLLLEEPDLLILDEPTNHLDLQATEWLEGWVRGYHGAVLLISHDRTFLENTAQRVVELRDRRLKSYPGDFRQFLKLREEEDARLARVAEKQAEQIAKLDEFVRRFMNSQRTAQARGRLKLMNRLVATKIDAPKNDKGMKAGFKKADRSGDVVLATEGLQVGYPGLKLIDGLDWTVRYGERWGVIGENGAGKSSLVKTIFGEIPSQGGKSRVGSGVEPGFFSQDAAEVDPDVSPLEFIVDETNLEAAKARDLLGRFLIGGDDVYRPVGTLSGGEKNKLVLALLTYLSPNLLVLDEPTNHLDMASRDALAQVLKEYTGTLVLVSHDRWLLGQVTDHIIDVRRAGPVQYPGSYDEYRDWQRRQESGSVPSKTKVEAAPTAPALSPRELSKEIGRLTKLVDDLLEQVSASEDELASVEAQLASLPANADILTLTRRHGQVQEELAGRMSAWEEQTRRLEELSAMQGPRG